MAWIDADIVFRRLSTAGLDRENGAGALRLRRELSRRQIYQPFSGKAGTKPELRHDLDRYLRSRAGDVNAF